jgi:F0F1-type ATP synthase membrane subunit b/b'
MMVNNEKVNNSEHEPEQEKDDNLKFYPDMLPLNTLFVWFMGILNSKTWEYLGLMMNPETKEINQDLKKAKTSIDTIEFLLNQIKDELEAEDKKHIADLLASLQMNYVEKFKDSNKAVKPEENGEAETK